MLQSVHGHILRTVCNSSVLFDRPTGTDTLTGPLAPGTISSTVDGTVIQGLPGPFPCQSTRQHRSHSARTTCLMLFCKELHVKQLMEFDRPALHVDDLEEMEDKECNLSPCQQFVTFVFVLLLHNLTLFTARRRGSQCHHPQSIPTRHTSRLASPSNLWTLGKRLPSPAVAPHLRDVANAFAAEHANSPLHLPCHMRARWEHPRCGARFVVGQTLQELLCLPRKASATFSRTHDQTRPRLHRRTRGTYPPPCEGASGPPRLSSAFFRCEPPHGGRTPMTRPKPAAGRLRETGLPQQPQTFLSHSQSPALKTNFDVEAPITSPRNDGFLNINLETWGHRSNSNISTSLFPQVLTLRRQPGCLTA